EACPVQAEELRVRVQVVGDIDRKGVLDRAVQEEEEPREDDQAEQVVTAEETEAGLGGLRLARCRACRSTGVRAPRLAAEECERGGVERQQPGGRDPGE